MNDKVNMHGLVKIYDENHKLIQEKNNMIVEEGRKKILNALFSSDPTQKVIPNFKYFYEIGGIETVLTSPEMTYQSIIERCTKDGVGELTKSSNITSIGVSWRNKRGSYLKTESNNKYSTFYSDDIIVTAYDSGNNKVRVYENGKGFKANLTIGETIKELDCTNSIQSLDFSKQTVTEIESVGITVSIDDLVSNTITASLKSTKTEDMGSYSQTVINGDLPYEIAQDNTFSYEIFEDKIKVVYSARIAWDDNSPSYKPLSAVGLFWSDSSGTNHLFSRAAIDPIYMNPNRTYIVEHTIYL